MPRDNRLNEANHSPETNVPSRRLGILDAPPKTTFMLGLFAGIAVTAVTFLLIGVPGKTSNTSAVKGAAANTNTTAQPAAPTTDFTKMAKPTSQDHYRGAKPEDAKIVLVEYSDFECPYCLTHHPTLKRIIDEYGDQVSWVYRHFPLTSRHPQAEASAAASECAGEQGKFWEYADKLYENQTQLGSDLYTKLAKDLKLNESKFADCVSSGKYRNAVTADLTEGDAVGISGTPATVIMQDNNPTTGQLVSGARPYESFKAAIDQLL